MKSTRAKNTLNNSRGISAPVVQLPGAGIQSTAVLLPLCQAWCSGGGSGHTTGAAFHPSRRSLNIYNVSFTFVFLATLAIAPLAALCFGLCSTALVRRACHRSTDQSAPQSTPSTAAPAIGTGNESQIYRKESFFRHIAKLVPKQAGM